MLKTNTKINKQEEKQTRYNKNNNRPLSTNYYNNNHHHSLILHHCKGEMDRGKTFLVTKLKLSIVARSMM